MDEARWVLLSFLLSCKKLHFYYVQFEMKSLLALSSFFLRTHDPFCRLAVPWGEVRLPENHVKGKLIVGLQRKGEVAGIVVVLPWMVCLHKGWQIGQTFLPQSSHQGQTPKQKRENAIVLESRSWLARVKIHQTSPWEMKIQSSWLVLPWQSGWHLKVGDDGASLWHYF